MKYWRRLKRKEIGENKKIGNRVGFLLSFLNCTWEQHSLFTELPSPTW